MIEQKEICAECGRRIEYYQGHWLDLKSAHWLHVDPYPDIQRHIARPKAKVTPPKPVEGGLSYEEHRRACMFNLPAAVFGSSPRKPKPSPQAEQSFEDWWARQSFPQFGSNERIAKKAWNAGKGSR